MDAPQRDVLFFYGANGIPVGLGMIGAQLRSCLPRVPATLGRSSVQECRRSEMVIRALYGPDGVSWVGSCQGDPARTVIFENLLTRPDPIQRKISAL